VVAYGTSAGIFDMIVNMLSNFFSSIFTSSAPIATVAKPDIDIILDEETRYEISNGIAIQLSFMFPFWFNWMGDSFPSRDDMIAFRKTMDEFKRYLEIKFDIKNPQHFDSLKQLWKIAFHGAHFQMFLILSVLLVC